MRKKKRHPYLTAQISCPQLEGQPAWRGRIRYDDDMYVCRVGPNVEKHFEPIMGWSVWSVEEFCSDLDFGYLEKWQDEED